MESYWSSFRKTCSRLAESAFLAPSLLVIGAAEG